MFPRTDCEGKESFPSSSPFFPPFPHFLLVRAFASGKCTGYAIIGTMFETKQFAAILSFGCSVAIAVAKGVVGFLSGSLSILAEVADSLVDLASDSITFFAVRIADLPPDANHPYGHARAENLGSLGQAVLMIATYGWLLWESGGRLIWPTMPDLSIWVFISLIVVLIINVFRVVLLKGLALKLRSEALAASVINFQNDILRSLLILVVLSLIVFSPSLPIPQWWVVRLDALVAGAISLWAIRSAWIIGARSLHVLMDGIPEHLNQQIKEHIAQIPPVVSESLQVRARFLGGQPLVEVQAGMPRGHSLEEAHDLAHRITHTVRDRLPDAQVTVSIAPIRTTAETYSTAVYSTAHRLGLRVHNLNIYDIGENVRVEMDLELPGELSLQEAHSYSEQLEGAVRKELPGNPTIAIHLEPRHDHLQMARHHPCVPEKIAAVLYRMPYAASLACVETLQTNDGDIITIRRLFPGSMRLTDVHIEMARMERDLRRAVPELVRVQIDPELASEP